MISPLVTAPELAALLDNVVNLSSDSERAESGKETRSARREQVRVLDVRWSLSEPDGLAHYEAGHIPGAVYVDLETELSRAGEPQEGRHPLPAAEELQTAAQRWGLNDGDTVVVYDDWSGQAASRAWWLLRYMGVADVRVLDGALPAWVAAGYPLSTGSDEMTLVTPGTITLNPGHEPVLTADDAASLAYSGVLLDARAGERYRGEVEPMDPIAGHIPGALSAPTAGNLDESGHFLDSAALRERYEALGVGADREVGVYCGSGVSAAHDALALTIAGFRPALFPGSWSAWSNQPGRPVSTGANP